MVVREDDRTASWRSYDRVEQTLAEAYDRVACYPLYARGRIRPVDVVFRMEVTDGRLALYGRREDPAIATEPEPCAER